MSVNVPSPHTLDTFSHNRLACFTQYLQIGEVVPHFFTRGLYFLSKQGQFQVTAVANSCLYRGYKLVSERKFIGQGPVTNLMHGNTYTQTGELISPPARYAGEQLDTALLTEMNGFFFFNGNLSIHPDSFSRIKDPQLYLFENENLSFFSINWKALFETLIDDHNQADRHPGLNGFAPSEVPERIVTNFESGFKIVTPISFAQTRSHNWNRFAGEIKTKLPNHEHTKEVVAIFPGMLLEFFPGVMVVTQLVPLHEQLTTQYTHLYFESCVKDDWEFTDSFTDAYNELAHQRGVFAEFLHEGREVAKRLPIRISSSFNPGPRLAPTHVQNFDRWLNGI